MPHPIDRVTLSKAQGDPWTPDDANIHPRMSDQVQANFTAGHTDFGAHKMPAAQASAIVRWTGSAYVVGAQSGGVTVTRLGVGHVRVALSGIVFDGSWMACGSPFGLASAVGAVEFANGPTFAELKLGTPSKDLPTKRDPIDCSFVFEAFGEPRASSPAETDPQTPRYRIAQDDVLDVELINRVSLNAVALVESIGAEHAISGPGAGDHNLAPVPIGARLYDFTTGAPLDELEPEWSLGAWHEASRVLSRQWVDVIKPGGFRLLGVRAFVSGASVDDTLRVTNEPATGQPGRRLQIPFLTTSISRMLILAHGVRG